MDFDFTQEQVMLRTLTREFFSRESTPRAVRTLMDEPRGYSDATWQQISEMGLPGLAIDPGYGGQGLGMIEMALVLEEMGRVAYPGPYFATSVLAASAIALGGYANAGQVCISVQRVVADRAVVRDLLDALVPKVEEIKLGAPSEPDTGLGSLISEREAIRVETALREGSQTGACGRRYCGSCEPA